MVAVLTAALVTAAEISSLFSALGVVICFICMVIFILRRINDEDIFGTSVVHVAQPPVAQVQFQKVAVPFSLELYKPTEATFSDVEIKIKSDVSYVFRSYWGVMTDHLHSLMAGPWSGFNVNLIEDPQLSAEIINEPISSAASESFKYMSVGLEQPSSSLSLGISPRKKYPLVIFMVRQDSTQDADPSGVGALISIIHIKDSECQVPTCILHQFLKQYSGQLTRLQALYTQSSRRSGESPGISGEALGMENSSSNASGADTQTNITAEEDDDDIPIEEACVVCQTNRITRALLPCRHVCVCRSCFGRLETCPMCRAKFLAYFLVAPEVEEPTDDSQGSEDREFPSVWRRMYAALNNIIMPEH